MQAADMMTLPRVPRFNVSILTLIPFFPKERLGGFNAA
ncbi:MAG: hypothetical protein BWX99_01763 [Deltaproteobacteria bacterium ADurb.Bin151]|nr:MAG: hypothetical protein BWX99_01763 [Deltaproteobacteria bacterium ADurb.Bin151]